MGDAHFGALLGRNDELAVDQGDVQVPAVLRDVLVAGAVRALGGARDCGWIGRVFRSLRCSSSSPSRAGLDLCLERVDLCTKGRYGVEGWRGRCAFCRSVVLAPT